MMPLQIGIDAETEEPVLLAEDALLRHVVILGATGAGKTVLGKAFLEEAVRAGVPVIAVDPQGDLASLALRPTSESAEAHPVPAEIADEYWSCAAVSILTPGSTRGTPVALNPLKRPPSAATSEDLIISLDALAESLAAAMGYDPGAEVGARVKDVLFLTLQGAMKSGPWPSDIPSLVRLLERDPSPDAAKLLTSRERAALVRRAESMTVGAKGLLFTAGPALDVEAMLQAPSGRVPVNVVYTGGLRNARERELVVATLCKDVVAWMTARPSGDLRLVVYIDEVAGLCPPHPRNPPAKKFLSLLFRQARKYGVGVIVATQNVTDLDYKALGQASTWALGRLMAKQDLDRVRHVVASVHAGPAEKVLAAIPALRAGEFILLSPDNLRSAQRLAVRGLATRHEVVPEEKFREILATGAISESDSTASERASRRRRTAAAATRAAKAIDPVEVEEGIGGRVLGLFDDGPGFYGPEEIGSKIMMDGRFLVILLRKFAEHRLLRVERIDGRDVYWDPTIGFDPRRGAPKRLARFPLRFPLVKATKRARDRLRRRMLVIPNERIVRKDFYYLPLWRVEAEVPSGGRTEGRAVRQFYVNAVTGELGHAVYGRLTFEEIPRKDAVRLEPLVAESVLEHVTAETVNDPIPIAKVGPSQAQEIVRTTLGAKPTETEPELVLLPMWRFDVRSNGAGRGRTMWMEGTFGSVFDKSP